MEVTSALPSHGERVRSSSAGRPDQTPYPLWRTSVRPTFAWCPASRPHVGARTRSADPANRQRSHTSAWARRPAGPPSAEHPRPSQHAPTPSKREGRADLRHRQLDTTYGQLLQAAGPGARLARASASRRPWRTPASSSARSPREVLGASGRAMLSGPGRRPSASPRCSPSWPVADCATSCPSCAKRCRAGSGSITPCCCAWRLRIWSTWRAPSPHWTAASMR
jgi:hypothetical protein